MPCSISAKYYIFYTDAENDHAKLMIVSAFPDVIKLTSHSVALELQHLPCPFYCKSVCVGGGFWSGLWQMYEAVERHENYGLPFSSTF